jgi:hypothetical protein
MGPDQHGSTAELFAVVRSDGLKITPNSQAIQYPRQGISDDGPLWNNRHGLSTTIRFLMQRHSAVRLNTKSMDPN